MVLMDETEKSKLNIQNEKKNSKRFYTIYLQNVDVTAISLILAGLARCGAFGCFDEFNRLQEATLSVLSMIIQPIQSAIQQKSDTVTIFDEKVCFICLSNSD